MTEEDRAHQNGTCDDNCRECDNERATAADWGAWYSQDV